MSVKVRVNEKTGKKEYKCRYTFTSDNKRRDSETGWFETEERAIKEAEKLKKDKEKRDREKIYQRRDKFLVNAFEEFVDELKVKYETDYKTTDRQTLQTAESILHKHMQPLTMNTKISNVDIMTFKAWMNYINGK